MADNRTELMKKYNISAGGDTTGAGQKSTNSYSGSFNPNRDYRSELLEEYNIAPGGNQAWGNKESTASLGGKFDPNRDYRSELLEMYSQENVQRRLNIANNWLKKYSEIIQGINDYNAKREGGYTRDVSGGYSGKLDELIEEYDEIQPYAVELGWLDSEEYLKQLLDLRKEIRRMNEDYGKLTEKDYYQALNLQVQGMDAGIWPEDMELWDVPKIAEMADAAEKEYDDFIRSQETASIQSTKQIQDMYNQLGIPFDFGYSVAKENEWNAKEKELKKKADNLRLLANQYKMNDLMTDIDNLAEQAEQEYQEYIHSEEYAAWKLGRQQAQDEANRIIDEAGIPMGLPSYYEEDEKEKELRAKASYYRSLATSKHEEEMMEADMKELESWPEEDQLALKQYIAGRTTDFYETLDFNNNGIQIGNAERQAAGLFEKYGKDRVDEIAESYSRMLNRQEAENTAQQARDSIAGSFWETVGKGTAHSIGSVAANLVGGLSGMAGYANELGQRTGRYSTLDPNNIGMLPNVYAGAVRSKVSENIENSAFGSVGSTLYQAGMSALDNLARIVTFGDVGSLALAGVGSFSQAVSEYSAKGSSPLEAVGMGIINGSLEILTEKVSLDNLLKDVESGQKGALQILKDMLIQGGIEVSEEELSFIGATLAEAAVLQERSSFNQQIAELQEYGMTKEEAREKACWDLVEEAAQTALQSFLSGGMMSGATSVYSNKMNRMQERAAKMQEQKLKDTVTQAAQALQNGDNKQGSTPNVTVQDGVNVDASAVQQAERISKATGRQIEFYASAASSNGIENGYFQDGKIYVNSRSGNPVAQIISHELTHSVEMADAYKDLSSMVMQRITQTGVNVQQLRQEKADLYARNGVTLKSQEEIDSEIVADYIAQHLLTDEQSIMSLTTENPSLGKRILNWIDGLLAKLGNTNAQERTFLTQARSIYAKALGQTGAVMQSENSQSNTTKAQSDAEVQSMEQMKAWADEQYRNGDWDEEQYDVFLESYQEYMEQNGIDSMAKEDKRFEKKQYSYAGINAQSADMEALQRAKDMQEQGVDNETIRRETGWFQGMDGKWRFEISDENMKYHRRGDLNFRKRQEGYNHYRELIEKAEAFMLGKSNEWLTDAEQSELTELQQIWGNTFQKEGRITEDALPADNLSDYIQHEDLFEAYPQLQNAKLKFEEMGDNSRGSYNRSTNTITVSSYLRSAPEETLLHEIQHIIQNTEGFAGGASVEYWQQRKAPKKENLMRVQEARKKLEEVTQRFRKEWPNDSINLNIAIRYNDLNDAYFGEQQVDTEAIEKEMQQIEEMAEEAGFSDLLAAYMEASAEVALAEAKAKSDYIPAVTAYKNTAGEIEARDTANRRDMNEAERQNIPPDLGDDNTVFVEVDQWLETLDAEYGPAKESFRDTIISNEEVKAGIQQVVQMDPVVQITGEEFKKGEKDLVTQATEFFEQRNNTAYNEQIGEVIMDRKGAKSDLGHGIGRKKAAAFATVPYVIEHGQVVDYQVNWKNRGYDTAVVAAPVLIGDEEHFAGVIMIRSNRTNRFYVHEVLTTKDGAMPFKTGTRNKGNPSGDAPSLLIILNKLRAVKQQMSDDSYPAQSIENLIVQQFHDQWETADSVPDESEGYSKQFSISAPTVNRRDVAQDLRAILSRGGDPMELRQYVNRLEQSGTQNTGNYEAPGRSGSEAQQILQEARKQGISVDQYLRQNWEQYDVEGEWNADAREALEMEQRSGRRKYSVNEKTEDSTEETEKEDVRSTLPAKARDYLEKTERTLLNTISENLGVPYHAKRDSLKPIIQEISNEYLRTGTVSDETVNSLFNRAYDEGIVVDREFYDTYKDVKDHLRTTAVTISPQDQADIADFKEFRNQAWGTLRIVKEGGLPVDTAYQELHEMAPNLFPESITHPADQLKKMFEVGQSIRVSERSLDEYYGEKAEEYRSWAKNDFATSISDAISNLRKVKRYAEDQNSELSEDNEITINQAEELWANLKDARRNYEKVNAKNLLTREDEMQVGRLLRGEILPEHVTGDNAKSILAIYNAKQAYENIRKQLDKYKKQKKAKNMQQADSFLETALTWKDKRTGIAYSRETMRRNIFDIVPDQALAERIVEEYFEPVHTAEAKSTRFKTEYRDRVRSLNLSTKAEKGNLVSEAHAVQLLGEAMDNIRILEAAQGRMKTRDGKNLTEWRAAVDNLWLENKGLDKAKIENAVQEFRKIYNELFQKMNQVRIENGYEPVNYRHGYFPHFQPGDGDGIIAYFGKTLGIDTNVDALPTTINGLTHTFKPGIQWFGNAQARLGFNTAYDAVEGFDKYIEGVASVIFQTENIQKLRALASQARYRTSDEGIRKQVDAARQDSRLTEEEKQMKIQEIYEKGKYTLSNFVAELDEYTNLLANKKSKYDRTMEAMIGRRGYTIMKNVESKVAANMIGGNISSALTNFIPLTQAWGRIGTTNLLLGIRDTARAVIHKDASIVGQSDFLTNRRGSDVLVQRWNEKLSNVLGTPMEAIDNVVSESIVRAAYYQNIKRGMSETEAMHQADIFAAGVMADRSKGSMPTLFESSNPLFKAFTQFQLEVNNQYSEIFKDIPREYKGKAKWMLATCFFKYFVAAFLWNKLEEKIKGRRSALDPIGVATDFAEDWKKFGFGEAGANLAVNVAEGLPFASALSMVGIDIDGGRVPVASAMPDFSALWEAATDRDMSKAQRVKTVKDEIQKPITYLLLPGGGNQAQKMWKGIDAYLKGGSYGLDRDGNEILQYPVYKDDGGDSFWNLVKSMIFGKNSTESAQNWVNEGFNSLNKFQTVVYQDMVEANVKDRDAYELIDRLRNVPKPEGEGGAEVQRRDQQEILLGADISDEGKAIAFYGMVATDGEKELMNKLTDAGADPGSVIKFVVDFKDADALRGTERREALRDTIVSSGLTEEEKAVAVGEILGTELETDKGNPTQYAKFLSAQNEGLSVDQYMEFYSKGVNVDNYLELVDNGMSSDGAAELAISLEELEPEAGKDSVSWLQQCDVILDSNISDADQVAALEMVSYESTGRKIRIGYENGLEPGALVDLKRILPDYDADGNGSYSQKEVTAAIDAMAGDDMANALFGGTSSLTNTQKAVLWQLQTNAKDGKSNPYDKEVGKYIYDLVQERKEAAEKGKETGNTKVDTAKETPVVTPVEPETDIMKLLTGIG